MHEKRSANDEKGSIAYFWQQAHAYGAKFFVDGELVLSSANAAHRCVQEDVTYMADYILDSSGEIAQVRLDRVKVH